MGLFSKKEDTKHIKDFDIAFSNVQELAHKFRSVHFESLEIFEKNFQKEKSPGDLRKERELFETHMDILQQLKLETDNMMDEAFKILRNETALTEKDRIEIRKLINAKSPSTNIKVSKKDEK